MTTRHKANPRRRAAASPGRLAVYAVLLIVVGIPLVWVAMPPEWGPLLTLALGAAGALLTRAAFRATRRAKAAAQ